MHSVNITCLAFDFRNVGDVQVRICADLLDYRVFLDPIRAGIEAPKAKTENGSITYLLLSNICKMKPMIKARSADLGD